MHARTHTYARTHEEKRRETEREVKMAHVVGRFRTQGIVVVVNTVAHEWW